MSSAKHSEKKRIAIVFHSGEKGASPLRYIIGHLAKYWVEDGHDVFYVCGTRQFVPADIAILHVNLSVVPKQYVRFASRYPIVLNRKVLDIRKRTVSESLLGRGDHWDGPVIVKSDLNYGGIVDREFRHIWRNRIRRLAQHAPGLEPLLAPQPVPIATWADYAVYDRLADVPARLFDDRRLVVERFQPEFSDGLYHLRVCQVLGDRVHCTLLASPDPVVKAETSVRTERVEPHAEVLEWRTRLGLDYGKLDYVIHEGRPVLLDVNKTVGASTHMPDETLRSLRAYQAAGIYAYFS